jgi:hypothetical protein
MFQNHYLRKKFAMETLIINGESTSKANLIMKLAKEFNFSVKKLTDSEVEEIGLSISIDEGIKSGVLNDNEKSAFLKSLNL